MTAGVGELHTTSVLSAGLTVHSTLAKTVKLLN